MLLALLGLGAIAWPLTVHWAGKPTSALCITTTRTVAQGAIKKLRAPMPDAARLLDRLVADAEVITAQETSKQPWERTAGRTEIAWGRVQSTAHGALVTLHSRRSKAEGRWKELSASATESLRQARVEADEAGIARREIAAFRRADYQLGLATKFAKAGEFDRANVAAQMALDSSTIVHKAWRDLHARFKEPKNLALWRSWVNATIARSRAEGSAAIVVDKLGRRLIIYKGGEKIATYDAEIGAKGLFQKFHSGDQATPEGRYKVVSVKSGGATKYYKALLIDYPNAEDRARYLRARASGRVPLRAGPGNLIEIHGDGGQGRDWTDGCVALTNRDMDQVFRHSRLGTPVTIVGTF